MMTSRATISVVFAWTTAACTGDPNPPLIFGQTQTVGITIAGSPVQQGGEFTLGYRDANIASCR